MIRKHKMSSRPIKWVISAQFRTTAALDPSKYTSPDQILSLYGAKNAYLLFVWLAMATVWGLTAMPMMVGAFLMDEPCLVSDLSCSFRNGSLSRDFGLSGNEISLTSYTASAFLLGVTLGSLCIPAFSDKIGCRPILLLSMFFLGTFGVSAALSPNIYSLIALRFLQGCFFTGCGVTNWVLAYESIPPKLRSYTALTFGLFWVAGYCVIGPLTYWLPNWYWLMGTVSLPTVITFFIYYMTIPESFHYVISRQMMPALARWLKYANYFAKWTDGVEVHTDSNELMSLLQTDASFQRKLTPKNLWRHFMINKTLFLHMLIMIYLWTCDTFVYYGLSLFSTQLSGSKYVNFTLTGLVEVPSYIVSPFLLNRLGRRYFVSFCHFIAAVSFLTAVFFDNPMLQLCRWLLGKFAIACAFTSLFVYASELFPTVIRNGCIGVCSFVARTGGTFASTVQLMAAISPAFPTLFFGSCATVGGMLTLLLLETLGKELQDSIDDDTEAVRR